MFCLVQKFEEWGAPHRKLGAKSFGCECRPYCGCHRRATRRPLTRRSQRNETPWHASLQGPCGSLCGARLPPLLCPISPQQRRYPLYHYGTYPLLVQVTAHRCFKGSGAGRRSREGAPLAQVTMHALSQVRRLWAEQVHEGHASVWHCMGQGLQQSKCHSSHPPTPSHHPVVALTCRRALCRCKAARTK